ncbi:hypothetical protein CY91_06785 [Dehalococcoides mccartyi]|jgi:hypothetical protein|uniref:Uncharacterized protein n=1 Tax=Dehalococcoides mccartyi TaxID=61435 RepID=A0A142VA60_9CHLR|nr:hypothetical protein [Dehalococcoides mccartyi]AGG07789.1 hypothetical protein btf_694 [Dehalococcoides mccartyi BTF08]AII60819.1 hypothetical protein X794_03085 [Dehalococcoides mccartyi CG5]AMU86491.1 hypothetical protein Dm11a5_0665 [Dehalococcoides mccartyi]AOV99316.1 hypothetical protein DCWBC2_0668 [Dehalococcoides mccartyi]AQW62348.1 hypothetical protein B1779_03435 [Dehalococcoides mccartyi]
MIVTVTSVTTATAAGLASVIGGVSLASLIVFLIAREMALARKSDVSMRIARYLHISILPLFLVMGVIVITRVLETLAQ